jgi:hypothetical protein
MDCTPLKNHGKLSAISSLRYHAAYTSGIAVHTAIIVILT